MQLLRDVGELFLQVGCAVDVPFRALDLRYFHMDKMAVVDGSTLRQRQLQTVGRHHVGDDQIHIIPDCIFRARGTKLYTISEIPKER